VNVQVIHGDAVDVLTTLGDASVDAVVTDPPYGISFMGKQWDQPGRYGSQRRGGDPRPFTAGPVGADHLTTTERSASMHAGKYDLSASAMRTYQQWCEDWATDCLRVLKPGGHLLTFGGARTWHRLAAGVEDAGFEIRDSIAWLYGSGFPKSMNVAKAIASGTGRPEDIRRLAMGGDYEPSGRGRVNYDHGAGSAMNGTSTPVELPDAARQWQGWGTALKPAFEPIIVARKPLVGTVAANVQEHGTGALNIDAARVPGEPVPVVPRGKFESGNNNRHTVGRNGEMSEAHPAGRWPTNVVLDAATAAELDEQSGNRPGFSTQRDLVPQSGATGSTYGKGVGKIDPGVRQGYNDSGGASRFFPVFRYQAKAPTRERPRVDGVAHPTVKPLELMRWLVRLVTPPGGLVLDPFAGSGTTGEACLLEGFRAVLIEREADYIPLIHTRLERAMEASA
jgi:site-specific DNA-methyltransferase (adenine-specific)